MANGPGAASFVPFVQYRWWPVPESIVRLVGQMVRVSVETVEIVKQLPVEFEPGGSEARASR